MSPREWQAGGLARTVTGGRWRAQRGDQSRRRKRFGVCGALAAGAGAEGCRLRGKEIAGGICRSASLALDENAQELRTNLSRHRSRSGSYDARDGPVQAYPQGDAEATQQREEAYRKPTKGASASALRVAERTVETFDTTRDKWMLSLDRLHCGQTLQWSDDGRKQAARERWQRGDNLEAEGRR